MSVSYTQISEEVGYTGHMPYPTLNSVQNLFNNLCSKPTISDFKDALKVYRFTPEARTPDQMQIIHLIQAGMSLAMKHLYLEEDKKSLGDTVKGYLSKLMPAVSQPTP